MILGSVRNLSEKRVNTFEKERKAFEYVFVICRVEYNNMWVDVYTHYPESGGNGAIWTFKYTSLNWIVDSREIYMFVD